jgi:hypothetical protein
LAISPQFEFGFHYEQTVYQFHLYYNVALLKLLKLFNWVLVSIPLSAVLVIGYIISQAAPTPTTSSRVAKGGYYWKEFW